MVKNKKIITLSMIPLEKRLELINKNINFFKTQFINIKEEERKLSHFLNNETNRYGLPKIHIKLENYKKLNEQYVVKFFFGNQTKNIDETIEQLLLMETDVEKIQMLNENKVRFNILSKVMPNKFDFSIYERDANYEVYFDRYRLTLAGWIKGPVSKERIQFIKGKSMDKQILKLIKRLEFTTMYSENLENRDVNEVVSLFMIEKIQGTNCYSKLMVANKQKRRWYILCSAKHVQ
jgi:hypothetical protein